jgi:hypothetical protein
MQDNQKQNTTQDTGNSKTLVVPHFLFLGYPT